MPRLFSGPWAWEISALIGVFLTFAVLVTLLAVFDGRPIFEWKSVTLNTIVSTLSLFIRGLLLYPISECIGQWKWILFEESERYLIDFERVDAASRGPLGSLALTWRRNIPWILRIGGVVTLLTLAVDPFSQQLVQIESTLRFVKLRGYVEESSTPFTRSYDRGHVFEINHTESKDGDQKVSMISAQPNITMEAAILNGMSQPQGILDQGFRAVCPTGNCTWEPFETLGVCYRCENVTSQLQKVEDMGDVLKMQDSEGDDDWPEMNATALALPNGHFLLNPDRCYMYAAGLTLEKDCEIKQQGESSFRTPGYSMTSHGTGDPNKTNTMQDLTTMIWAMSVIHIDEDQRVRRRYDEIQNDPSALEEAAELLDPPDHPINDPEAPLNNWPHSPVQATECALYYCVAKVEMSVHRNQLASWIGEVKDASLKPGSWEVVDAKGLAQENMPNNTDTLEFHKRYSAANMSDLVFHFPDRDSKEEFKVTQKAIKSIGAYFQNAFRVSPWADESEALELVKKKIPDAEVLMNGYIKTGSSENPPSIRGIWAGRFDTVSLTFKNLAASMTNEMRGEGEIQSYTTTSLTGDKSYIYGESGILTTVYRSGFYWILLHAVVLLLGVLFCILTMWTSTRGSMKDRPVWKNHSLAAMRQGAVWSKGFVECSDSVQLLEKVAMKEKVTMTHGRKRSMAWTPEDSNSRDGT